MSIRLGGNSTAFYLAALHFYGYSVTIPSPQASPDGLYVVTALGPRNARLVASRTRLDAAIAAAARKLGDDRLVHFLLCVGPDGPARKQPEAWKAGV